MAGRSGRVWRVWRVAAAVAPWVVASAVVTATLSGPLASRVMLPFQTLVPAPPPSTPEPKSPPVVQFEPWEQVPS
jgi:hypothetical protein